MFSKYTSQQKGWAQAFLNVLIFWGMSNIWMSYSTQVLEINKIVFALTTYATCSFCLLVYAGYGKLSKETMRSVDTWAYGIIMLLNYFITLNLFSLTSATEASLIQRFSVVFSVFMSWLFLLRKPNKSQLVGVAMIMLGVLHVVSTSPDDKIFYLYVLMFLAGIFQSLRIFVAELHRPNKKAAEDNSIKTRCRVIGYVMFVITLLFGSMVLFATYLEQYIPEIYKVNLVVEFSDLFSYKSILAGAIMGVFIYTPIRYLEFSAAEKIKTENYLAVTALSFFSTLFWEWATSPLTGLSLKSLSLEDFMAGVVVTLGALIMSIGKLYSDKKSKADIHEFLKVELQNIDDVEETRDILANSLEHFNSDLDKTADALGIHTNIIEAVFKDKEKILAFKPSVFKNVSKNHRRNVAGSDSLTGLLNRNGFMTALKDASNDYENLSLFFIDLNKFKPVNDTYGHEAGDFVLEETARRLKNAFPNKSVLTRLGGDEYCILLLGEDKKSAELKIKLIINEIEKAISYKEDLIEISASIGLASYPEDTKDIEELLKLADNQMYIEKSER
ncbi:MAG TPA: hypothetical protein DCL21_06840 [Alphaproteobacteria bacterium]|nr:hypothetical protein [Alphaproteobacteria bacterium]